MVCSFKGVTERNNEFSVHSLYNVDFNEDLKGVLDDYIIHGDLTTTENKGKIVAQSSKYYIVRFYRNKRKMQLPFLKKYIQLGVIWI